MAIESEWEAYCIDSAVATFGRALENELEGAEGKTKQKIEAKQEQILRKWMDLPAQYRNPPAIGAKRKD